MWRLCDACLCCYDDDIRFDSCPHNNISSLDFTAAGLTKPLPELLKVIEETLDLVDRQNKLLEEIMRDDEILSENVKQLLL